MEKLAYVNQIDQLEREQLILDYYGSLIGQKIVEYDRSTRLQFHRERFKDVYHQYFKTLIYLNSTKHPGYIVFFYAKHRYQNESDEDDEPIQLD